MTITPKQQEDIDFARSKPSQTLRPTVPAIEDLLFRSMPVLDHGFLRVVDYNPTFLVGLAMAASIAPESGPEVNLAAMRQQFAIENKGLVDPESGAAQMLVEFDPDYSIAPILRGGQGFASVPPLARKKIFEQLILEFRRRLEIGALRRGVEPVAKGAAGNVGKFLAELHQNGHEHGSRDSQGRTMPSTRFMRLKKHAANNKQQLLQRCAGFSELARHVERSVSAEGFPVLIEASVSDFGLGIVDAFATSAAGRNIQLARRDLLEALIYERLEALNGRQRSRRFWIG